MAIFPPSNEGGDDECVWPAQQNKTTNSSEQATHTDFFATFLKVGKVAHEEKFGSFQ